VTQEEKQITTVMRPAPPILPEAAGLVEISRHFAKYHADQILVTGRQEKIVGLISFGNLTKALFDAAPQTD
jgi:predicted transcriptional regulator